MASGAEGTANNVAIRRWEKEDSGHSDGNHHFTVSHLISCVVASEIVGCLAKMSIVDTVNWIPHWFPAG